MQDSEQGCVQQVNGNGGAYPDAASKDNERRVLHPCRFSARLSIGSIHTHCDVPLLAQPAIHQQKGSDAAFETTR